MKQTFSSARAIFLLLSLVFAAGCNNNGPENKRITLIDSVDNAAMARQIEASVSPTLAGGMAMRTWVVDSLLADPVSLDIDDQGTLFYTRTNRQKNSEFDIRGHQDWEIGSIQLKNIEEKRAFLHKVLAPERSVENEW